MLTMEGRCGGGIAYQDTARVHPCSLFLDIPDEAPKGFNKDQFQQIVDGTGVRIGGSDKAGQR